MKFKFIVLFFSVIFSLNVFAQLPYSPVLTEPPDLDVVVPLTPLLDWTDVSNATGYVLQISTSPDFSNLAPLPSSVASSQYQVPEGFLQLNTVYYWRVKAVNLYGASAFTDAWSFRTAGTPMQEIGHLSDEVIALVTEGILNYNQGNILINRLESAAHQLQLGHEFVAKLHLMLFKLRVLILRHSNLLPEANAERLTYVVNKIIALIGGDSGVPPEEITVNNSFRLGQNYPNPFNPTTMIEYTIPEKNHVTLKVFDMLGKEIASLVDKEQEKGSYIVQWNASSFSSGIYFYKLTSGDYAETRRMVLKK